MSDDERRRVIERYWDAVRDRDLERVRACVTEDFVEDWPQSGERIRGIDNWHAMATNHPTYPSVDPLRTIGGGDVWVTEVLFDYGGDDSPWRVCAIFEVSGERIGRVTEYFGPPFDAPEWREEFTERIPDRT
jgi:ketosteroid isomerase-like protein